MSKFLVQISGNESQELLSALGRISARTVSDDPAVNASICTRNFSSGNSPIPDLDPAPGIKGIQLSSDDIHLEADLSPFDLVILKDMAISSLDGPNFKALVATCGERLCISPPLDVFSTPDHMAKLLQVANLIIPSETISLSLQNESGKIPISTLLCSRLSSDRTDGLFPTVVSAPSFSQTPLGLVYSSLESIHESIVSGRAVYHSRKRGLWHKGSESGNAQVVQNIAIDCDSDAVLFTVQQQGEGFCHIPNRTSCFGIPSDGAILNLQRTIKDRVREATPGSYTNRLLNDAELLRAKLHEEVDELMDAKNQSEAAFEAADVIYFLMVRCGQTNTRWEAVCAALDEKAAKTTRRLGDAKPAYMKKQSETATNFSASKPKPTTNGNGSLASTFVTGIRSLKASDLTQAQLKELTERPANVSGAAMAISVQPIIDQVKLNGDSALLELTSKFDRLIKPLQSPVIHAPFSDGSNLPTSVKQAIDVAYANIKKFHTAQLGNSLKVETMPGVICSRFSVPIQSVGIYVPGGTAVLPSTALMLGVPAQVAQCPNIIMATPPLPNGAISPEVSYVATLTGVKTILLAGGAQAVAALAYGTESVAKVDKIFGPGNQWVTAAKVVVAADAQAKVGIDMPAGPSEVLVIADSLCNPTFVASDLLSQAEHGADSQVVLLAVEIDSEKLNMIQSEVERQTTLLPRENIVRSCLSKSFALSFSAMDQAMAFSNEYAPEHLILHVENASQLVSKVINAGSVFVGGLTPESCGDYASGTNHTLPTSGYAKQYSGVNTQSFQKHITSQEISPEGLRNLGPHVVELAECEGLRAHANAVRVRLGQDLPIK